MQQTKLKVNWYKLTESNLYELKTLDVAIKNLQKRDDEYSQNLLKSKIELRESLKETIEQLSNQEFTFINMFYNKQISPVRMQQELNISQATFYRMKRTIVKKIAQYMGYL